MPLQLSPIEGVFNIIKNFDTLKYDYLNLFIPDWGK